MKLRNKKTGEIVERVDITIREECVVFNNDETYNSLAELNDDWEDYEEPKYFWFIDDEGDTETESEEYEDNLEAMKSIGNYFETEEEAKKAVEKLKAWKRLKDKGFSSNGWTIDDGLKISICTNFDSDGIYDDDKKEIKSDLDICFGGEE